MAFQKGHKHSKGRPKGSANKRTDILAICESLGFNPFQKMAELAQAGDTTMLKELCGYLEPKLKALEHSTNEEKGFVISIKDYGCKK